MSKQSENDLIAPRNQSVGYIVRNTFRAFTHCLEARLADYNISISMWFFLRLLWEGDGRTQKEISDELGLTQPTTVAAIDNLERRGFVMRQRNGDDRRKSNIFLTPSGRDLKAQLIGFADEVNEIALSGMSERERADLKKLLLRATRALDQA